MSYVEVKRGDLVVHRILSGVGVVVDVIFDDQIYHAYGAKIYWSPVPMYRQQVSSVALIDLKILSRAK